ncbi:MAG: HEAT repeat domain-containing protein, partial [Pirellulaceae bacterium]
TAAAAACRFGLRTLGIPPPIGALTHAISPKLENIGGPEQRHAVLTILPVVPRVVPMSQSSPPDGPSRPTIDALSPDDVLPPVEPPSARFIVQLFVVPLLIVAGIVMGWLLLLWMTRGSDDLHHLIARIRVPNEARFQAAHQLASALVNRRNHEFKQDGQAAKELASILDDEIDEGGLGDKAINLRIFLCRALGEFHVEEGIDVLLKAATTQRGEEEVYVRQAAIAAIAVRAERASDDRSLEVSPAVRDTMLGLARDPERRVREVTAVALSWLGSKPLLAALQQLLDDVDPNVRYNAATGLARIGDPRAIGVLVEMLDPEERAGIDVERQASARDFKRAMIFTNALRATRLLAEARADCDLSELREAIKRLTKPDIDAPVRMEATSLLNVLEKQRRPAESDSNTGVPPM